MPVSQVAQKLARPRCGDSRWKTLWQKFALARQLKTQPAITTCRIGVGSCPSRLCLGNPNQMAQVLRCQHPTTFAEAELLRKCFDVVDDVRNLFIGEIVVRHHH